LTTKGRAGIVPPRKERKCIEYTEFLRDVAYALENSEPKKKPSLKLKGFAELTPIHTIQCKGDGIMQQQIIRLDNGNYGLLVNNELYAEGTFEQCSDMMWNNDYYDGYVEEEEE
jgi:hypothetical protein